MGRQVGSQNAPMIDYQAAKTVLLGSQDLLRGSSSKMLDSGSRVRRLDPFSRSVCDAGKTNVGLSAGAKASCARMT